MRCWTLVALLAILAAHAVSAAQAPAEPPARAALHTPRFEADTSQVPDLQPWGRAAEALCQSWYPRIVAILAADDAERPLPPVVKIYFERDMKGVAYAGNGEIHIAADWVRSHPNDFGMVAHELTHLVQRYPRTRAGWLVEGIADYVRLQHFEPALPRPRIDFARAKYTDAYKTTASFLIWLEEKHGADLTPKLSNSLRSGNYTDARFKELTGKELPELWSDFAASPQ
ncbi:MAG: basic secretory protein-like protein [Actinomycetota bacterium]